jgi:hypothetical protein
MTSRPITISTGEAYKIAAVVPVARGQHSTANLIAIKQSLKSKLHLRCVIPHEARQCLSFFTCVDVVNCAQKKHFAARICFTRHNELFFMHGNR